MSRHYMDICGEGDGVARSHLLLLASEGGVSPKSTGDIIDRMLGEGATFAQRTAAFPIRQTTARQMKTAIDQCSQRLTCD